jgi:hypothetical protein
LLRLIDPKEVVVSDAGWNRQATNQHRGNKHKNWQIENLLNLWHVTSKKQWNIKQRTSPKSMMPCFCSLWLFAAVVDQSIIPCAAHTSKQNQIHNSLNSCTISIKIGTNERHLVYKELHHLGMAWNQESWTMQDRKGKCGIFDKFEFLNTCINQICPLNVSFFRHTCLLSLCAHLESRMQSFTVKSEQKRVFDFFDKNMISLTNNIHIQSYCMSMLRYWPEHVLCEVLRCQEQ